MFSFFKRKPKQIPTVVKIWMTENARNNACFDLAQNQPSTTFVAWFEETRNSFTKFANAKGITSIDIQLATYFHVAKEGAQVIFLEHHPLQAEEQQKFESLGLTEASVYTSMEEPLFGIFGGEKIVELMKKMGMREDDLIEHNLVTKSIKKAQDKIAEKAVLNSRANSQADWLLNAGIQNNQ
mgnify:CR=1 FL=1